MKRLTVWMAALALLVLLTACGGESGSDSGGNGMSYDAGDAGNSSSAAQEDGWSETAPIADDAGQVRTNEKRIYTGTIEAETKDFDAAHQAVSQVVAELGGYFERQSISQPGGYRYGDYVIRVEAENFAAFFDRVGSSCHVTYTTRSEDDVTDTYYDVSARLETAQTKLDRLQALSLALLGREEGHLIAWVQALLAQAETMEDIITIESAISETELTVEQLTGSLRGLEGRIQYATITMTLREVYQFSGEDAPVTTFGGRMGQAFTGGLRSVGRTLENLAVFLAYNWVWLLLLAGAAVAGVAVHRKRKRRQRDGKLPPAE